MPKGEIPGIPDYLQDSVRSAAAYEQDVRREFQIEDYARKRQIPETSMENRTVHHFVTVLRDADAARDRLGRLETKQFVREADPLAYERMVQASLLYAAEKMILEEGFQAHLHGGVDLPARSIDLDPVRRSSLTRLLDRAVGPYGLSVAVPDDFYGKRDYEAIPG